MRELIPKRIHWLAYRPVRLLLLLPREGKDGGGEGHPEPHQCLCRRPSWLGFIVCASKIVGDNKATFFPMKNNFSLSCSIFSSLCDGMVDPQHQSRTWVYQNAMVNHGWCKF